MGNNDWTCAPREHDFTEISRYTPVGGYSEPPRLYCRKCGWVREIPLVNWCVSIGCALHSVRHEEHPIDIRSILEQNERGVVEYSADSKSASV